MKYDLVANIGSAIDNVYNNSSESGSRKTVSKLDGECLLITYRTILNLEIIKSDKNKLLTEIRNKLNSNGIHLMYF